MPVEWTREIWKGAGGDSTGISNSQVSRHWLVKTTLATDNEFTIIAAATLPILYEAHPTNAYFTARKLSLKRDDKTPLLWHAQVDYDTAPYNEEKESREAVSNPLDRRARISWSSIQYTKPVDKDINGNGVLNAAGDYFDPPPEMEDVRWTATLTKNLETVPSWLLTYANAINDADFVIGGLTVLEKCARIVSMSIGELHKENDTEFYPVSFTMEFRAETWTLSVLNQGFRELVYDTKTNIVDDAGSLITSPALLDASGECIRHPTPADAVYLDFDVYTERDFSVLPLT